MAIQSADQRYLCKLRLHGDAFHCARKADESEMICGHPIRLGHNLTDKQNG